MNSLSLEILEIGPNQNGVCVVVGNGSLAGKTFGFSVEYNVIARTIIRKVFFPRKFPHKIDAELQAILQAEPVENFS